MEVIAVRRRRFSAHSSVWVKLRVGCSVVIPLWHHHVVMALQHPVYILFDVNEN